MILLEIAVAMLTGAVIAALALLRVKRLADRQLRNAIAALPAGIAFYDKDDRLFLWNDRYKDVAGASAILLRRGMRFRELLEADLAMGRYPEAAGRERQWLGERLALRNGCEEAREQKLQDGRCLRVQDRHAPDGGTVSICVDITDVKRGEDSFKLMFDNNPVPMWLWDGGPSLRVLDLNKAALDHLGYARADITRLSVFDLLSGEDGPALRAAIATGVVQPFDGARIWRPRRADGTLRYAIPYIHMLPVEDGQPRFVGAIVDVTDRMNAERELRANADVLAGALARAESANRTKSEFLAAMSHELRTPLNAIIGFSDIIRHEMFGPVGNPRYFDYIRNIHGSGSHLLGLINDILDLSRLDAGEFELRIEAVDMRQAAAECLETVAVQAAKGRIALASDVAPVVLRADRRRLRQMLLNLLSNAVKFTPEGGSVMLTAALRADGFAMAVRDTGIGIAPEDIPKALERFGQIDSSLGRKYEGTGLGLPLTKQMAELHGASLTLDSAPGAGTTASIVFPPSAVAVPDGNIISVSA